jgi:hypothetical protein
MKRNIRSTLLLLLAFLITQCGSDDERNLKVLIVQPDGQGGKDAIIRSSGPDQNYGGEIELAANVTTAQGPPFIQRALFDFDLSKIPAGSEILMATLSLWYAEGSDSVHSVATGPNTAFLQRITSTWNEATVTWNNQPASVITNRVIINSSSEPEEDYPEIDATLLVQDMIDNRENSFGFLLMLETETGSRGLYFASSDHPDPELRPRLHVRYLK